MSYAIGSLVRARGREWVVLPESQDEEDLLVLRPLGGSEDEITGIYLPLETVESAEFPLPDPAHGLGNNLSCRLLRDAVRLGFRAGAGPFRSLARIGIEPRPYQLVPLLMALRLDPVRMLIADDVGIGKTVEALLVARELLDRAEIRAMTILCPPHLAEQWQKAMNEQFHIDAALVLPGTAARLERDLSPGESIFQRYPFTVVSMDYVKQERRRHTFLNHCPEMVIVDEAHTCSAATGRSSRQRRHELLQDLARDEDRHLILVTATPHSGKDEAFRSLLGLLDPEFLDLPEDMSGEKNRSRRERLAAQFVQRRRADLKAYMDTVTPFPERDTTEEHYSLKPTFRKFFTKILRYCRESVLDKSLSKHRQRVRWWSAIALLRALSSSPAAAASTLRNRSITADAKTEEQVDEVGRRAVLDLDEENLEGLDVIPGSDTDEGGSSEREKLRRLAREADKLAGKEDAKLVKSGEIVKKLLDDGFSPILFCRFIPTVEYVAAYLRGKFEKKGVVVEAIDGTLPPAEREKRVEALGENEKRVLVCTDCLSEGINLQEQFDAVVHYDLSWNPTRHEQREGRVDRYGQPKERVRTLTYYGQDNPVDGIVLQVLLRKHKAIQKQLGIIVPVPMDSQVIEDAILEGLLLKEEVGVQQLSFDFLEPMSRQLHLQWDAVGDREKRSRTLFAQNQLLKAINEELAQELAEIQRAIGGEADVRSFMLTSLKTLGAVVSEGVPVKIDLAGTSSGLRDALDQDGSFAVVFGGQPRVGALKLTRTHPVVEGLSSFVLESALDSELKGIAKRCGVIRTKAVSMRTTVLLVRMRFHIIAKSRDGAERPLLAEDLLLTGFRGSPDQAEWISPDQLEPLLTAVPAGNLGADLAQGHVEGVLSKFGALVPHLGEVAEERGQALYDSHRRVRKAARLGVRALQVDVHEPVDILGLYIYLPAQAGGGS